MLRQDPDKLHTRLAELEAGLHSVRDMSHATLHLLAHLYTSRCLLAPDPIAEYKDTAMILLGSLGATGEGELPDYEDKARNAIASGLRHHIGQFLLLLQAHVEANLQSNGQERPA
jgi:hypothetical protein